MNYEFQSMLYPNARTMLDVVAYEWMTAGGANSTEFITESCQISAQALAAECIKEWSLDDAQSNAYDDDTPSWMDENGVTIDDITEAFSRFIANRPDIDRE
jgi:hypothetical protein